MVKMASGTMMTRLDKTKLSNMVAINEDLQVYSVIKCLILDIYAMVNRPFPSSFTGASVSKRV